MTLVRGFTTIILSALAFGTAGALIGWLLGALAPDFYHAILRPAPDRVNDPVQVGIGIGLVNGLMIGLGIGALVVVVTTWWNVRILDRSERSS